MQKHFDHIQIPLPLPNLRPAEDAAEATWPSSLAPEKLDELRSSWAAPSLGDGLIPICKLPLPGPRRAKENRGGASAIATTISVLARCPLLDRVAAIFSTQTTGRPTPPARYWWFYGALARKMASFTMADRELESHWDLVRAEFAARGINLPKAKPDTTNPIPGYHAYNRWRSDKITSQPGMAAAIMEEFTTASLELAWLIRDAEGRATGDPLNPSLGEILAGDATVFQYPSSVTEHQVEEEGRETRVIVGSRAVVGRPRTAGRVGHYKAVKKHGATDGLYHLALLTKGYDTYTRVVLDVKVAAPGEAESVAALPMLHRVLLAAKPGQFQTVAYDGQMYPTHALELMRRHGIYVINHNAVAARDADGDLDQAGITRRQHGQYRDKTVRTYYTHLPSLHHDRPNGTLCIHHLISDDGALYAADRAPGTGTPLKQGPVIRPSRLSRHNDGPDYRVSLHYRIPCPDGDLPYEVRLSDTKPKLNGTIGWDSDLAAHRVIPEAWAERYRAVFGARNQAESYFSWLEKRYFHKDRAASWKPEDQHVDLISASLLHNAETWAHYIYRHVRTAN